MSSRTGRLTALAAIVQTCLLCLGQPAVAQTNTLQAKASFVDVCVSGAPACTGTITQGGILNGTTVTVFSGPGNPTPDPNTFSFAFDLTITTNQGQLKVRMVNVFNVATGVTSAFGSIDPSSSTGRFAGATGVLFFGGKTVSFSPFTVKLDVTGEISLAD